MVGRGTTDLIDNLPIVNYSSLQFSYGEAKLTNHSGHAWEPIYIEQVSDGIMGYVTKCYVMSTVAYYALTTKLNS